jgi:hypothetical protein
LNSPELIDEWEHGLSNFGLLDKYVNLLEVMSLQSDPMLMEDGKPKSLQSLNNMKQDMKTAHDTSEETKSLFKDDDKYSDIEEELLEKTWLDELKKKQNIRNKREKKDYNNISETAELLNLKNPDESGIDSAYDPEVYDKESSKVLRDILNEHKLQERQELMERMRAKLDRPTDEEIEEMIAKEGPSAIPTVKEDWNTQPVFEQQLLTDKDDPHKELGRGVRDKPKFVGNKSEEERLAEEFSAFMSRDPDNIEKLALIREHIVKSASLFKDIKTEKARTVVELLNKLSNKIRET